MLDLIQSFARQYPIMAAVLSVVVVAALFVMADEYRRNREAAHRTQEQILEARRRAALTLVNRAYENEPRWHEWR